MEGKNEYGGSVCFRTGYDGNKSVAGTTREHPGGVRMQDRADVSPLSRHSTSELLHCGGAKKSGTADSMQLIIRLFMSSYQMSSEETFSYLAVRSSQSGFPVLPQIERKVGRNAELYQVQPGIFHSASCHT